MLRIRRRLLGRRALRRAVTLGTIGGLIAYRRQRLDAADRAFPEARTRTP